MKKRSEIGARYFDLVPRYMLERFGFDALKAWQQQLHTRCIGTHIYGDKDKSCPGETHTSGSG